MNFCSECGKIFLDENAGVCINCENSTRDKVLVKESDVLERSRYNSPIARLTIKKGGTQYREFPIYSNVADIGRWDPNIDSIPEVDLSDEDINSKVSRKHARIIKKEEGFYIQDLSSRNGTFLNREFRLLPDTQYALKNEDEVIIGNIFFKFTLV